MSEEPIVEEQLGSGRDQAETSRDGETLGGEPVSKDSPTGLSRRSFLRLAGVTAASVALGACAGACSWPQTSAPSPAGNKVQLVYQDWRTDWFPPMAREMLEEFHATHPNIRVFYVPDPENLEEKMLSDMQAGIAADVFQGCCTQFPIWAQKGYTLDLRPYVAADLDQATIDDWDPAQYRWYFTPEGQQFGLPKYHGALALYYNKDIFDQYKVPYPDASWNHNDYLEAMRKLTHDTNGDGVNDIWGGMVDLSWERIQVHVNAWGGHFVDPVDPYICRMSEPPAMEAMEWIRARMWDERVMASPMDVHGRLVTHAFASGQLAMAEDGSWGLKDILATSKFRVGVAPFPSGPARRATLATTDGFGIYAGTKHPEAAWELVKFLISKQYGLAMAKANFLQPARASLVEQWVEYVRQEFPVKAKDVDIEAFADGHIKGYSVATEIFADMDEARRLTYAAWDQIFATGRAPVKQMEAVCRRIGESRPYSIRN